MTARLPAAAYALLAVLCAALFLPGFFDIPPFDRDEARFAQASHQMLESGDLVDIRFQDEPRHKKPAGIYWLQSAATLLADTPAKEIWTYRIPSLLGATLSVLLTAWAGTRLFGPAAGFLGAAMLAGCVVLGVEARMAKTDAVLLACVVAAQAALAVLYLGRNRAESVGWGAPLAFWIAAGLGVLIKGPIVLMVSGLTLLLLAAWDRRAAWMRRLKPLKGLGILLLIAAPWLIAITIQTKGAFFAESVGHDMMGKVAGGQEGKGLPPGYYLGTFWITFAPWAFLVLPALPWIWRNRNEDAVRFCIAWILPSWIVFEAVPTKLLHYTLPVFPAIALLTARAMLDGFGGRRPKLFAVACVLGLLGTVGLAVAVAAVPWAIDRRIDARAVAVVPIVLVLAVWTMRLAAMNEARRTVIAGLAAVGVLYAVTYQFVLPGIDGIWISRAAARTVAEAKPCPESAVASAGYSEPSLVFLAGTQTRLVNGAAAAAHLLEDRACAVALVESRQEAEFRAALGGAEPRALGQVQGLNYNNGRRITLTLYGLKS